VGSQETPVTPDISIQILDLRWKSRLRPYAKTVREAVSAAFRIQDSGFKGKCELTVVLANDEFVRELNKTYRGKDKATNILSFPSSSPESRILNPESYLGDIILAYNTIASEAREQGKSFRDHTVHLLVHGVLHLLGHDHENDKEAEIMEAMEIKILKKLGIRNPYL
jgi:probable rRNA maturation factor